MTYEMVLPTPMEKGRFSLWNGVRADFFYHINATWPQAAFLVYMVEKATIVVGTTIRPIIRLDEIQRRGFPRVSG